MRSPTIPTLPAAPVLLALLLAAPAAWADEFRLEMTTVPAPLLRQGEVDTVIEASGVEPIDGRRFLVAHDKAAPLHVVDLETGALIGAPLTSPRFPATNQAGPKWEGLARDAAGNYYAVGAHNGKSDEERATKSVLVRFRLKDTASEAPAIDDASVVRWQIARALERELRRTGLPDAAVAKRKVEGLAVRERRGSREVVVGLREPGDTVRAYAFDVTNDPSPGAELAAAPGPLFSFQAAPREGVESQLTALEHVPALGGFLVLTATEDAANVFHGNTLWFVADGRRSGAVQVATFEVAMKAEGLAVLGVDAPDSQATAVKLLIAYDNDAHATKNPSRFQAATLVRRPR